MTSVFHETAAEPQTRSVPLSHVSLELGHLYMEDFAGGPERLREHFAKIAPWAETARAAAAAAVPRGRPRISTCFLIDDYFTRFSSPAELVPMVLEAAKESGLVIDYLARESACARAGETDVARVVEQRLVESPAPGSDGRRPPAGEVGWLSNGARTPGTSPLDVPLQALSPRTPWQPPRETAARRHSVFVDVELWDEPEQRRVWSCPFLAAVWQLARLGLLRHRGEPLLVPQDHPGAFPEDWDALPSVIRLNERAAAFSAYRIWSLLPSRFLPVEHAVRVILEQTEVEPGPLAQAAERAMAEGITLPEEIPDRIAYVFLPES
ncbi:hypothetical protein SRB5_12250 [Streptomyces sp. RB5]|uniref:Uncharacterized protein n=1 Tax=Streptomyces smaragdinus TaxID=2585196 RepID=A0A7K0CCE3_9ACTN|nr:SCO2522 family protein [Streptomyces smaragdinus]MQY11111.1 hypothetical protein [Streptomyces smaragdinus]